MSGKAIYLPGQYKDDMIKTPFDAIRVARERQATKQAADAAAAAALLPPGAPGSLYPAAGPSMMTYILIGGAVIGLILFLKKRSSS